MKRNLFKIAACLLTGVMFFTAVGCNSDDDDDPSTVEKLVTLPSGGSVNGGLLEADASVTASYVTIANIDLNGKVLTVEGTGVTLDNLTNGTIIIGAGVGNGDATINGCTVTKIKILGGGANSIHFKKKNTVETVEVAKEGVSLKFEEQPEIAKVEVNADNVSLLSTATEGQTIELANVEVAAEVKTLNLGVDKIAEVSGGSSNLKLIGDTVIETKPESVPAPLTIKSVEIKAVPTKKEYKTGDKLNLDGLKVLVTYSDDTTEEVTEGFVTSGFDSSKEGEHTVTVTYMKKNAGSFKVTVTKSSSQDSGVSPYKTLAQLNAALEGATLSADQETITLANGKTYGFFVLFNENISAMINELTELSDQEILKYPHIISIIMNYDKGNHGDGNHGDDGDDGYDDDDGDDTPWTPPTGGTNPFGTIAETEEKLAGAIVHGEYNVFLANGTPLSGSDLNPILGAINYECAINNGINKSRYPNCYAVGKAFHLPVDGIPN